MAISCDSNGSDSFFDCLLFDLDDTLYSRSTGMAEFCKKNIDVFLMQRFGLTVEDASKLRVDLFRTYGSSLAGLRALGYDIDADEYHSFVHGRLPYELLKPDAELRDILKSIKKRKLVRSYVPSRMEERLCFLQLVYYALHMVFLVHTLEKLRVEGTTKSYFTFSARSIRVIF